MQHLEGETENFRPARDGEGEANFVIISSFPSRKGLEKKL